jgi:cytochrome c oxidase subunit 4
MNEHITPRRTYFFVYLVLIGLLVLTVVAGYTDLGGWGVIVAVAIAAVKAMLILIYFMHVRTSGRIVLIMIFLAFALLSTLIVLSFSDYLSRGWVGGV